MTMSDQRLKSLVKACRLKTKSFNEYLSTDNWLFSCLPRGEQLLENLLIIIFKLGNCTNPRADYEIQLVGAGGEKYH
ncbi:MAG: hypothetical protein PWR12_214 [Eubacteriaceae bacterium]|nr:hypothetical protein [Eubacteriaceae bacterium]MDK2936519.1 hypothetical protein [Eubacteriaceae bacterium]